MALLRNAAGTKLLVNAGEDALKVSLDGASCPDPCGGCVPASWTEDHPCALVTLSGVEPKILCTVVNSDGTFNRNVRALSTAGINNSFRVVPLEFDGGILGEFRSRDDFGEYISSTVGLIYRWEPAVGDNDYYYHRFMNIVLNLTRCVDGRERVLSIAMNTFDGTGDSRQVFRYNYLRTPDGVPTETDYYLGDAIPNEITAFDCEGDGLFGNVFKNGTATVTIPNTCGVEEPRVFEAVNCETGVGSIFVAIENSPVPESGLPYFPKNGGIVYRPIDPLTSSPQNIGTTWVQEVCDEESWPTAARCDGLAGEVTFDPEDRPGDANIFTVSSIDYYPNGGEDVTTPSSGTWSEGECGNLKLATRCSTADILNVPQDVEDQIPESVSYDDVLLGGGLAADFTVAIQVTVARSPQNGGTEYCLQIPYQCTDDDADGSEYQVSAIEEIPCNAHNSGQPQGEICGGGTPSYSCTGCCPIAGGSCDSHPDCNLCLCCILGDPD